MQRSFFCIVAFATALAGAGPALAQQGGGFAGVAAQGSGHPGRGWQLLAFKTVGPGTDRDTIRVNTNRWWRQIQLCSINAPIQMKDFDIYYRNGRKEDVDVRARIAAGSCTRPIDLRGGQRRIVQIRLQYGKLLRSVHTPLIRVMAR